MKTWREFKWGLSVNKWSVVMWGELTWFMWSDFILKLSEVKLSEVKWSEVTWGGMKWFMWSDFILKLSEMKLSEVKLSEVKRSEVVWGGLKWFMWSDFSLKWSEVKWSEVKWSEVKWSEVSFDKVLGDESTCTLGWPYTGDTWLYCDYFIWCVSCTVVVLTCYVMCGCMYVWEFCNVWVFW